MCELWQLPVLRVGREHMIKYDKVGSHQRIVLLVDLLQKLDPKVYSRIESYPIGVYFWLDLYWL